MTANFVVPSSNRVATLPEAEPTVSRRLAFDPELVQSFLTINRYLDTLAPFDPRRSAELRLRLVTAKREFIRRRQNLPHYRRVLAGIALEARPPVHEEVQ